MGFLGVGGVDTLAYLNGNVPSMLDAMILIHKVNKWVGGLSGC